MPLIIRNKTDRAAIQLAHASALRSTNEVVEQLAAQVKQLRAQLHQAETEKATLARELCEARLEIALRDQRDLLARADSPSQLMH